MPQFRNIGSSGISGLQLFRQRRIVEIEDADLFRDSRLVEARPPDFDHLPRRASRQD